MTIIDVLTAVASLGLVLARDEADMIVTGDAELPHDLAEGLRMYKPVLLPILPLDTDCRAVDSTLPDNPTPDTRPDSAWKTQSSVGRNDRVSADADIPDGWLGDYLERWAILEYDGGLPEETARLRARDEILVRFKRDSGAGCRCRECQHDGEA